MPSTAAAQSPADLANLALVRMGYRLRVGSLYDGSLAAKKILDVYAQTRDNLIRDGEWGFADRNLALTLLKQAPAMGYIPPNNWNPAVNPAVPWLYEYGYPADCLKVRAVKPQPLFLPNFDPQHWVWEISNDDSFAPAQRVILSNVPPVALIDYNGQVTDPTTWDVGFVQSLAAELALTLGPALVGLDSTRVTGQEAAQDVGMAMVQQG